MATIKTIETIHGIYIHKDSIVEYFKNESVSILKDAIIEENKERKDRLLNIYDAIESYVTIFENIK